MESGSTPAHGLRAGVQPRLRHNMRPATGAIGPTGPQGEPGASGLAVVKDSAVYKGKCKCELWREGYALPWNNGIVHGDHIYKDADRDTRIILSAQGRYLVSVLINVNTRSLCHCNIEADLLLRTNQRDVKIFSFMDHINCANTDTTIELSGILVENFADVESSLRIKLKSPESLRVEDALICIVEI